MSSLGRCAVGIAILATACRPAVTPRAPGTPSSNVASAPKLAWPKYETLPRFARLWSRPGVGRYGGTVGDRVYYTVDNDGASVHAVDLASGKTLWQTSLATPVRDYMQASVVGGALVLVYPSQDRGGDTDMRDASGDMVVAQLATDTGRLGWSKRIPCPEMRGETVDGRLYLSCASDPLRHEVVLQELDLTNGSELARVTFPSMIVLVPGGGVCGSSVNSIWCGRIAGRRFDVVWSQPTPGLEYARLSAGAGLVTVHADGETVARRVGDGRVVWARRWNRRARSGPLTHDAQRLLVVGDDSIEVVRHADGATLAKIAVPEAFMVTPLSDGERILIAPNGKVSEVVYLVDAQSRVRALARNVAALFWGRPQVGGGVLLADRFTISGANIGGKSLEAYSLTQFAPAQERLAPNDQVVSVLERYYFDFRSEHAARALQPIPGWATTIQTIIASGPDELRGPAIAVAARSRDPRFLAPLRDELERFAGSPEGPAEESRFDDVVKALANLRTPDAPAVLLSYWQRIGHRLPRDDLQVLRPHVVSSIWSYGARGDQVGCKDMVFASLRVPPDRAVLGTASPGVPCAVDPERRWAAIGEARADDNGNGKLDAAIGISGRDLDELALYLVLGSGPGTPIDDFVAADPRGRWIVVIKDMCVYLVDADSGKATALKGADGRPGAGGEHRAASFSPDGKSMIYIKSKGERASVVRRDLKSGIEQRIDPGPGDLNRAFFDASARFVVMDFVEHGPSVIDGPSHMEWGRPPLLGTTYRPRGCSGSAPWATYPVPSQDRPVQRFAALADARVHDVPEGKVIEPAKPAAPRFELVTSSSARPVGRDGPLPLGPFRWHPASATPVK